MLQYRIKILKLRNLENFEFLFRFIYHLQESIHRVIKFINSLVKSLKISKFLMGGNET